MKNAWGAALVVAASVQAAEAPFGTVASTHFKVQHESSYAPAGVLNVLEGLHAKLLLDLLPFAPWAKNEVIEVYIYKDGESYYSHTGAPSWAGGHVEFERRRVHVFESDRFARTMAHELAHLFFDDYFESQGASPPAWLNEGVATLMEWDYGLREENRPSLADVLPLADFLTFSYQQHGHADGAVALWYRQASSVVEFLMRRFSRAQFVTFCDEVRRGASPGEALPRAYRLRLPDLETLERLWRRELE